MRLFVEEYLVDTYCKLFFQLLSLDNLKMCLILFDVFNFLYFLNMRNFSSLSKGLICLY